MSLKKIDLTKKVNKVTLNNTTINAINAFSGKFPQLKVKNNIASSTNPILARMSCLNTLQNYVVKALNDYTGCSISESSYVIKLANTLKETPVCEISHEEFDIIEKAIENAPAHVKASWNDMVISLNTEVTEVVES
jgi:ribosomal protein S13